MSLRLSLPCLLLLALLSPLAAMATPPLATAPSTTAGVDEAAAPAEAPTSPRVMLVTTMGEITLELDAAAAPRMVENFLAYARDGHYNGTVFHRVIPGLLVQAGAFTPDLQQKPSRQPIASEAGNGLSNRRGTIAAARDRGVIDSATAQFFVNLADNPKLDQSAPDSPYTAGYTVFGRVVQGLDVIDRIAAVPTAARGPFPAWVPTVPVVIERVQMLESSPAEASGDIQEPTPAPVQP